MTPIEFPEQNIIFAKDQPEYIPLPALKQENGDVITCWRFSDEEIEKLRETKTLYLSVKTFNQPLQPIYFTVNKNEVIDNDLEECIGCAEEFDYDTMQQDSAGENYCSECWKHFKPILKAEYEELKAKGEID